MTLRFDEFVFNQETRQLRRGGADVRLSPKGFDLLGGLLARRPDVVSKRDLMALVWPDTFVVEANLNVVIAEIRRTLGDDRQAPRFIRTVHGIGYAFCAQAFEVRDGETAAPVLGTGATAGPGASLPAGCWLTHEGRTFPLSGGENLIGRDPRSAVWLEDESVSRRHAAISVDGGQARLEDLESTNGTFLNRETVEAPVRLQDGDVVGVGSLTLTFRMLSGTTARTRRLRRG